MWYRLSLIMNKLIVNINLINLVHKSRPYRDCRHIVLSIKNNRKRETAITLTAIEEMQHRGMADKSHNGILLSART